MKKVLSLFLTLSLCLGTIGFPMVAYAATVTVNGFTLDTSTYTITSYSGTETNVTIPSNLTSGSTTYPVKAIGSNVFKGKTSITGVAFQEGVTSIGSSAFYGCTGMSSVTLPNSMITLGDYAFYNCNNLTGITIPDNVTSIGASAFTACSKLSEVTLSNSLASLGTDAFLNCIALTAVTIPGSLTTIGNYIFQDCTALTNVTISSGASVIGENVFSGCTSLTSVTLPDSLTSIGKNAFYGCSSLTEIILPGALANIGVNAFGDCTRLAGITIPGSVVSIGDDAFHGCSSLTTATIQKNSSSTTIIGASVFEDCTALSGVTLPNSVASLSDYTFYNCKALSGLVLPESLSSIGSGAFSYCAALTEVTIPSGVTSIGGSAFSNCSRLATVNFMGNAPATFGTNVFSNAASGFTIYYSAFSTGFTTPTWNGYNCQMGTNKYVEIPDPALKTAFLNVADSNGDGQLTPEEMLLITDFSAINLSIQSIEGIQYAVNLERLNLNSNEITDLAPMAGLTSLTDLYLYDNNISDLSPLFGLTGLKMLMLWTNQISNINALSGLTGMEHLDIRANQISDISALAGMNKMTCLEAGYNPISDLSPLAGKSALQELYLEYNPISTNLDNNIQVITGLSGLTQTCLVGVDIKDAGFVAELPNLVFLDLTNNRIEDISPVSGLVNLKELILQGNKISSLPENIFSQMNALWSLNISENFLDLSTLTLDIPDSVTDDNFLYNKQLCCLLADNTTSAAVLVGETINLDLTANEITFSAIGYDRTADKFTGVSYETGDEVTGQLSMTLDKTGVASVSINEGRLLLTGVSTGSDSLNILWYRDYAWIPVKTIAVEVYESDNRPPWAESDIVTTKENTSKTINVLDNDSDPDGDALTVISVFNGEHGTVTLDGNIVTYTPENNYTGADIFKYIISDDHDAESTGAVYITIIASNTNLTPVAIDDTASTNENTPVTISVLANDSDPDGDALAVTAFTNGANGTVISDEIVVTYTPDADYTGTDSFTYTISDGNGETDTATVTVMVNPVNQAPIAVGDTATTDEETSVTITVLANDSDPDGDTIALTDAANGSHGIVTIHGDSVKYEPDTGYSGTDSFTYTISDGNGGTATATVIVSVNHVNHAPAVITNTATLVAGTTATLNGAANPNGSTTHSYFRYSTTNPVIPDDTTGTRIPASSGSDTYLGSGSTSVSFTYSCTGLLPGTTYYYWAIAYNSVGTAYGVIQSFTTSAVAPVVTSLQITGADTINIPLGKTNAIEKYQCSVYDQRGELMTGETITWSLVTAVKRVSIDPSTGILTVVKGARPGKITIAATCGSVSDTYKITLLKTVFVSSVTLSDTSITLKVGDTKTITATVLPGDATNQTVKWSSSNTGVASVDENGTIVAVSEGNATIKVTTVDGSKTASCTVTVVSENSKATGVTLNYSSYKLVSGNSVQLITSVSPTTATYSSIVWSSSDNSILSVDQNGSCIGYKAGKAKVKVTVTNTDGSIVTASCNITVTKK